MVRRSPEVEHERAVAIFDLLEDNSFAPASGAAGPFDVKLGIEENRLVLDIRAADGAAQERVLLPLTPFRSVVKEKINASTNREYSINRQRLNESANPCELT